MNLVSQQDDIDKIYLYAKDVVLIKRHENARTKHFNDSNTMDNVYEKFDDRNKACKRKILILFDDMIADIMSNKKVQAVVKELFIRSRKLNISLVFITQSSFFCSKRC